MFTLKENVIGWIKIASTGFAVRLYTPQLEALFSVRIERTDGITTITRYRISRLESNRLNALLVNALIVVSRTSRASHLRHFGWARHCHKLSSLHIRLL